jgi:mannose-1-phosphate guanylyltransferase
MSVRQGDWAIVLAAGDGRRLSSLTTDERGDAVPKQFCSLNGGPSLLEAALQRARRTVPSERVCAVLARQHERHWQHMRCSLPPQNVIVQPRNCGTANGVLLGLLHILERDPLAHIVFLPADHYVHDEASFADSMRTAAKFIGDRDGLTLLGIEPDDIDIELGYIVPGDPLEDGLRRVEQFVEKPTAALARDRRGDEGMSTLEEIYERLPLVDFSRSVMQGAESALRVSTAPACGWSDLGTPRRVVRTLQRLHLASVIRPPQGAFPVIASVDLAAQYARLKSR